jgi:hypothetical protein
MTKPGASFRYTIAFPCVLDEARPGWPFALLGRVLALRGVIDATFTDAACAWSAEGMPRRESHRQIVEVLASADARDELLDIALELKAALGAARVVVSRCPVELDVL